MENQHIVIFRKEIFTCDHAAAMVNRVPLEGVHVLHGHDFFEIAIAAQGEGAHVSFSGNRTLKVGDVIIIRPGAWHGYTHCKGLVIYNCCFDTQLLQREFGWLREDAALNFLLWSGPYADDRHGVLLVRLLENHTQKILRRLEDLREVQNSPHRTESLGRLLIFLDSLARGVEELELINQQVGEALHPAVLETMRLLEGQIVHAWSLSELADRIHLDPSYLVRLFKSEVGLSPIAYLNRCRVERAAGLLLHTLLPVSEVAAHVGWFDPNLFARRFRSAYGMSPSQYRKRFGNYIKPSKT